MSENKAAAISAIISKNQTDPLTYDKRGGVEATLANFIWLLEHDPNLDSIKYNGFTGSLVVTGPVPWHRPNDESFTSGDLARLEEYLEKRYEGLSSSVKVEKALAALQCSQVKYFDPVRDYFDSLPEWDGKERLDTLLIDSFQAEDSSYTRAVTRKTFCAVVARQYEAGRKFDQMLILVGKQGTGKSSFFERITPMGAYTDNVSMEDMKDKTAVEKIRSNLLVEIPELSGMRKGDINAIKAFITRQEDQYRPAYGRTVEHCKRRCVLVGTTNEFEGFLRDDSNRRFWPVYIKKTEKTMVALTDETVKQIWAEAKKRYQDGEKLYLETAELMRQAEAIQNASLETGGLEDILCEFLDMPTPADWDKWNRNWHLIWWKALADRGQFVGATGPIYRRSLFSLFAEGEYLKAEAAVKEALKDPSALTYRTYVSVKEIWFECLGQSIEDFGAVKNKEDKRAIRRAMIKLGWEPEAEPRTRRSTGYGTDRGFRRTIQTAIVERNRLMLPTAEEEEAANLRALEVDEETAAFVKNATADALADIEDFTE